MFESLSEKMKQNEARAATTSERVVKWACYVWRSLFRDPSFCVSAPAKFIEPALGTSLEAQLFLRTYSNAPGLQSSLETPVSEDASECPHPSPSDSPPGEEETLHP